MERLGWVFKHVACFFLSLLLSGCALDITLSSVGEDIDVPMALKSVVVVPFESVSLAVGETVSLKPIQKNAANFSISPSLPTGLSVDPVTGEIQGAIQAPIAQKATFSLSYVDLFSKTHQVQFEIAPSEIDDVQVGFYTGTPCALSKGAVYCWAGDSRIRAIGSVGSFDKIAGLPSIQSFKISYNYACALSDAGEVYCWGTSTAGALGLGSGVTTTVQPVKLAGDLVGKNITQISLGYYNACAIDDQKKIYCWGKNTNGQLGLGDLVDRFTPTQSSFLSGSVVEISTGENHTCASDDQGKAWCWGSNGSGQIGGGGGGANALSPVAVLINGTTNPLTGVSHIYVGRLISCAVSSTTGLSCWGSNAYKSISSAATGTYGKAYQVDASLGVSDVDIAAIHLCYIKDQEAYCAGRNATGNLGAGALSNTDGLFKVVTSLKFKKISVGGWINPSYSNLSCGLTVENRIACWGSNARNVITPFEEIKGIPAPIANSKDAVSISKETSSTDLCKAQNNQVYCAHFNDYARAGVSSIQSWFEEFLPIQGLPAGLTAEKVFTGSYANCALYRNSMDNSTELWCWGYNGTGLRGDGTSVGNEVATKSNISGIKTVSMGTHHICALLENSKVYCAGSNASLQLGDSASCVGAATSTQWCEAMSNVKTLKVSSSRNCVVTTDGDIKCWGGLYASNSSSPVTMWAAADGEKAIDLSMYPSMMCFLTDKGRVLCSGNYVQSLKNRSMPTVFEVSEVATANFEEVDTVPGAKSIYVTGPGSFCVLKEGSVLSCRGLKRDLPLYHVQGNYIPTLTAVPLSFPIAKIEYLHSDSICVRNATNDLICWGTGRDQETLSGQNYKGLFRVPEVIIGL
ncbi:MAG: RCC1 domain-containing protein [Bdellovibrio sp.]